LLTSHSTDEARVDIVIRGFHGLHLYANKFWYKHLLAYCKLQDKRQDQFPEELLLQLERLLKFRKKPREELCFQSANNVVSEADQNVGLEMLRDLPEIKSMVSDVIAFRAKLSRDDSSDKDPESEYSMNKL